eukprot:1785239-Pleurochrysis_carterae.AAC.5
MCQPACGTGHGRAVRCMPALLSLCVSAVRACIMLQGERMTCQSRVRVSALIVRVQVRACAANRACAHCAARACVRVKARAHAQQLGSVRVASMALSRVTTETTAAPDLRRGELERPRMLARWKSRSTAAPLSFLPASARSRTLERTRVEARRTADAHKG